MVFNLAKEQSKIYGYEYIGNEPDSKTTNSEKTWTGVHPGTMALIQADAERAEKIRNGGFDLAVAQAELYGYGVVE